MVFNQNIASVSPSQKEESKQQMSYSEIMYQLDDVSKLIFEVTDPGMVESVIPCKTTPDGNCLFRAASIAVYGDETKHVELRQKVFNEMRDNPNWYDKNDPNFCSPFANDPEILIENYSFYIEKTPKLNEWCDINHMLALSAVLMIPIKSYHPSVGGVSNPFCRLIVGRGVPEDEGVDTKLSIMWTSTIFPEKMEDFRPNHFVPLIPHKVKSKDFHQAEGVHFKCAESAHFYRA